MRHPSCRARVALLAALFIPNLANAADGAWIQLARAPRTPAFDGASVVLDSRRGRLIEVGGTWKTSAIQDLGDYVIPPEEIWSFDGANWSSLGPSSSRDTPNRYEQGAAVYDSLTDAVYAVGGASYSGHWRTYSEYNADVWRLDLGAAQPSWRRLDPTGTPPGRKGHVLALDAARRRLILFGGRDSTGAAKADTWSLDLDSLAWKRLPSGPAARDFAAAGILGDSLFVACGIATGGRTLADTWALDLTTDTWSPIVVWGPAGILAGAVDAARGRMLALSNADSMVTWQLTMVPPTWRRLATGGLKPRPRFDHFAATYVPSSDRLIALNADDVRSGYTSSSVPHALVFGTLPLIHVDATMTASYARGHTTLAFALSSDAPLYGPVALERQVGTEWTPGAREYPDSTGHVAYDPGVLQAGVHYDFRLAWFDGTSGRSQAFPLDTPPPPAHLDITADEAYAAGDAFYVSWNVPGDSARWLAPFMIERKDNGGPWVPLYYAYPQDQHLVFQSYNDTSGGLVSFRLAWGPTLTEHTGGEVTILTPVQPVFVAAGGNDAAAVTEWRVPPGSSFEATLYRESPYRMPVGPPVRADANGLLHFEDPVGAVYGYGPYFVAWSVGGTARASDPFFMYPSPQIVDLLTVDQLEESAVKLAVVHPSDPWSTPMILERSSNGATWDSLQWIPSGLPNGFVLNDATVRPGRSYLYRLRWPQGGLSYVHSHALAVNMPPGKVLAFLGPATNPLRGASALDVTTPPGKQGSFELYDARGRRVRGQSLPPAFAGSVSLAGLPGGVYFARLAANGEQRIRKLVLLP